MKLPSGRQIYPPGTYPQRQCSDFPARIVAALLENNQTPDGIVIPKALQNYTGFELLELIAQLYHGSILWILFIVGILSGCWYGDKPEVEKQI